MLPELHILYLSKTQQLFRWPRCFVEWQKRDKAFPNVFSTAVPIELPPERKWWSGVWEQRSRKHQPTAHLLQLPLKQPLQQSPSVQPAYCSPARSQQPSHIQPPKYTPAWSPSPCLQPSNSPSSRSQQPSHIQPSNCTSIRSQHSSFVQPPKSALTEQPRNNLPEAWLRGADKARTQSTSCQHSDTCQQTTYRDAAIRCLTEAYSRANSTAQLWVCPQQQQGYDFVILHSAPHRLTDKHSDNSRTFEGSFHGMQFLDTQEWVNYLYPHAVIWNYHLTGNTFKEKLPLFKLFSKNKFHSTCAQPPFHSRSCRCLPTEASWFHYHVNVYVSKIFLPSICCVAKEDSHARTEAKTCSEYCIAASCFAV